MPRKKTSPVPHLVSDAEYGQYPGVYLRLPEDRDKKVVVATFRDPRTGGFTSRRAGATREEILSSLNAISRSIVTSPGVEARDSKTPFSHVARSWFSHAAQSKGARGRPKYSPRTLDYKLDFYNAHIKNEWGSRQIGRVKHADIVKLLNRLEYAGVGAPARQKVQALLRNIFTWARSEGYILTDPTEALAPIRQDPVDRTDDYFTPEEFRLLQDPATYASLEANGKVRHASYYRFIFMLLLETGCRIGELAGVTWDSVRFSERPGESHLLVRASRGGRNVGPTKTPAGKRVVYISDELSVELVRHKAHQYDHVRADAHDTRAEADAPASVLNPQGLVCTTPWGRPLDVRGFRKRIFRAVCEEAGIDTSGVTRHRPHPHTARHTFFTHSGEAGVDMNTLMAVGGHSDLRATSRYMGTTTEAAKAARDSYLTRMRGSRE